MSDQFTVKKPCQAICKTELELRRQLGEAMELNLPSGVQPAEWPLEFLADYIYNVYHKWLRSRFQILQPSLQRFIEGHRKKHQWLDEVGDKFSLLIHTVHRQMKLEEEVIFPYIRQIASMHRQQESFANLFVKTLRKPLSKLVAEQELIRQQLSALRTITGEYKVPDKTCSAHQLIYDELQQLERNMHQYAWLETEVLFPRAELTERKMLEL